MHEYCTMVYEYYETANTHLEPLCDFVTCDFGDAP